MVVASIKYMIIIIHCKDKYEEPTMVKLGKAHSQNIEENFVSFLVPDTDYLNSTFPA